MSDHSVCKYCGEELITDQEQEDGYCEECYDNRDDKDYDEYVRQKIDEVRHPDDRG